VAHDGDDAGTVAAGGHVGPDDPTVAQLLDRWLAHIERLGRLRTTLYNYRQYVRRELVPALGSLRLSKLTAGHLDGLYGSSMGCTARCFGGAWRRRPFARSMR
jgi:hypothetical protein